MSLTNDKSDIRDDREVERKLATILMVDDEETTLDVLEKFLQGEGYENVIFTTDSREAMALIECESPDVVLLDLQMPNIDGLQILAAMKADEVYRRIPVLILTSATDPETKLQALEFGATDFLAKPVDPSELALRLRNTLSAKAYQDRLARHDGLTGLSNRSFFHERVRRALERMSENATRGAVLHLGLDRFKQVNDALGHRAGDRVLKIVAERLESGIRPSDLLGTESSVVPVGESEPSRFGGDEFAIFVPGVSSAETAARVARRVLNVISRPIHIDSESIVITASIGVTLFPDDGDNAGTLIGNAGSAMTEAKRTGGGEYCFYSKSLNAESRRRLSIESRLRTALSHEEIELHYQPKVEVRTGLIVGAEALMRWNHPELGMIPPDLFVPIAEESGLITSLGEWAIFTVCDQTASWRAQGLGAIRTAVNVSALQFRNANLSETFAAALQVSGLDGASIVIELTESVIKEDTEATVRLFARLKDLGIKLSIDDFGTGYSSLSNLKLFPVDELKIDLSFVKGVPDDSGDNAIVGAIIAMAHNLGMTVVAEGVERAEQLDFLAERGCDAYQGFLRSPAIPAKEFSKLLVAQRKAKR